MKQLRKNEFIDMLEMAEILYEEKENFIKCDIPGLGSITYYPKADRVQINRNNTWEQGGFQYIKNILYRITKSEHPIQCTDTLVKIKEQKSKEELRDDFAGLAMASMINAMYTRNEISSPDNLLERMELVSKNAYWYADQMLKQREL
jgi:hypothetical protein